MNMKKDMIRFDNPEYKFTFLHHNGHTTFNE